MLKIRPKDVVFQSQLDPEFNEFIGKEFTQLRERIRTFLRNQCDQMAKLSEEAAQGDRRAVATLLHKEKSRASFVMAVRSARKGLEEEFRILGLQ